MSGENSVLTQLRNAAGTTVAALPSTSELTTNDQSVSLPQMFNEMDRSVFIDTRAYGVRVPEPGQWDGQVLCQGFVADYKPFNFVDGPGVRCSLYVSGCPFKCLGCYNQAAQSFRYGKPFTDVLGKQIMSDLARPYVAGLSLLGGEPFLSTPILIPLVKQVRARWGAKKTIWVWSGYTFEQLLADTPDKRELLAACDVLVDGPYIEKMRDLNLAFCGSKNQRIIDVRESLQAGRAVIRQEYSQEEQTQVGSPADHGARPLLRSV